MNVAIWGPLRDSIFVGDSAYHQLQQRLGAVGIALHTHDVLLNLGRPPDLVIFLEVPKDPVRHLLRAYPNAEAWVILFENAVVAPRNFERRRHRQFARLFTWHDGLVDGLRYVKLNYPHLLEPVESYSEKRGFCTLIAAHKAALQPGELYTERIRAIRWYEQYFPHMFDLYGPGWDQPAQWVHPLGLRPRQLLTRLTTKSRPYPSWRGAIDDKLATLAQYRFSIAYENANSLPGYVTEKLLDCLCAGVIPVYLGAPNIAEHVPSDTFVDRRDFASHAELHNFLIDMAEVDAAAYVAAGQAFVRGRDARAFSVEHFVQTLFSQIAAAF